MNYGAQAAEKARDAWRSFSADDVLDALGLVRKSQSGWSAAWALGGIGLGLAVGLGLGLAFAPRKGSELRADWGEKLKRTGDQARDAAKAAMDKASEQMQ
jgi:hypothetical protein